MTCISPQNLDAKSPEGGSLRRRLAWTGLAGLAACVTCCTIPILAATGLGGGALATIAHFVRPGAELVAGGVVGAGTFAVLSYRRRSRQSVASYACEPATLSRTLFASGAPAPGEPMMCTADLHDTASVQAQVDGYRAAFRHLVATERMENGFTWVFADAPGLDGRIRRLAENEHGCCRFFRFDVRVTGDRILWEVRADARAESVLDEFSRLPERLRQEPRRGHDTAALERSAVASGLTFSSRANQ